MPFDLKKVLDERKGENFTLHWKYINPQLPKILGQIEFDRFYEKGSEGCYLIDDKGDRYLDLLSGFGVFALGRSHPTIVRALKDALDADLPNLVQMDCSLLSGVLAEQLVARSHPGIERVFFTNSGAEAVESAIKFARAATKRTRRILSTATTCSTGSPQGRSPSTGVGISGPDLALFLPGVEMILSGTPLLWLGSFAGVIVARSSPSRFRGRVSTWRRTSSAGSAVAVPAAQGPLDPRRGAGRPRAFGHLLLPRAVPGITPRHHHRLEGAVGGSAHSSGPCSARASVSDACTAPMDRAVVHSSTFSTNLLAMVAGLATLAAFEDEDILRPRCSAPGRHSPIAALQPLVEQYEFLLRSAGQGTDDRADLRRAHDAEPAAPLQDGGG